MQNKKPILLLGVFVILSHLCADVVESYFNDLSNYPKDSRNFERAFTLYKIANYLKRNDKSIPIALRKELSKNKKNLKHVLFNGLNPYYLDLEIKPDKLYILVGIAQEQKIEIQEFPYDYDQSQISASSKIEVCTYDKSICKSPANHMENELYSIITIKTPYGFVDINYPDAKTKDIVTTAYELNAQLINHNAPSATKFYNNLTFKESKQQVRKEPKPIQAPEKKAQTNTTTILSEQINFKDIRKIDFYNDGKTVIFTNLQQRGSCEYLSKESAFYCNFRTKKDIHINKKLNFGHIKSYKIEGHPEKSFCTIKVHLKSDSASEIEMKTIKKGRNREVTITPR